MFQAIANYNGTKFAVMSCETGEWVMEDEGAYEDWQGGAPAPTIEQAIQEAKDAVEFFARQMAG
jgi:hypothetical protein